MAEMLVKAVDAKHPSDPVKDARGSYKAGDVVGVRADGWSWGRLEILAPSAGGVFQIIKISDAEEQQLRKWTIDNWGVEVDGPDHSTGHRRAVKVDTSTQPAPVLRALDQTGEVTTDWDTLSPHLILKSSGETAEGAVLPEVPPGGDLSQP